MHQTQLILLTVHVVILSFNAVRGYMWGLYNFFQVMKPDTRSYSSGHFNIYNSHGYWPSTCISAGRQPITISDPVITFFTD